jgi:hypothetical protein
MNGRHEEGLEALNRDPVKDIQRKVFDERADAEEKLKEIMLSDRGLVDTSVERIRAEERYKTFDLVLGIIKGVRDEYENPLS